MAYCTFQKLAKRIQEINTSVNVLCWSCEPEVSVFMNVGWEGHLNLSLQLVTRWTRTITWSLRVYNRQQKTVSCSSKGWRDYLCFNYKVHWIWLTLNTAGMPKPCAVFVHNAVLYLSDGLQCRNKRPMNGAHPVLICFLNIRVNFQMYL